MADPISVLGTATGVISLALEVSKALHTIASNMRGAPKEVKNCALQINEVATIMASLQHVLEKEQHRFTPLLFEQILQSFERFHDINQEIKNTIPVGEMKRASWRSFLWAFKNRSRARDCFRSIETIKTLVGLAMDIAILAAVKNKNVETPMAVPDEQDTRYSTLYSMVGNAVEKNRFVIQRHTHHNSTAGTSNQRRNTKAQEHLRIQPSPRPLEDAATWLYRLVFLPATQHPDSGSGSKSEVTENFSGSSTANEPIITEQVLTTPTTQDVINSLLRAWVVLGSTQPTPDTPTGSDDFQARVREGIEKYNSNAVGTGVRKRKKRRNAPQPQSSLEKRTTSSSINTLHQVSGPIEHQGPQYKRRSQEASMSRGAWQTGRAMTISTSADSTESDLLSGPQGLTIPPDAQETSSIFSGFSGPNSDRRFSSSPAVSEEFNPRSWSPDSRTSYVGGQHADAVSVGPGGADALTFIRFKSPDGELTIDNMKPEALKALEQLMTYFQIKARRSNAWEDENRSNVAPASDNNDGESGPQGLWGKFGSIVSSFWYRR